MNAILVQMSDELWTPKAVHFACALARANRTSVILLQMIPVSHPQYLGSLYGFPAFDARERHAISQYAATAEDYLVPFVIRPIQYVIALDAVAEAAEACDAEVVLANVPASIIPFWRSFRTWQIRRRLAAHGRRLITLADDSSGPGKAGWLKGAARSATFL